MFFKTLCSLVFLFLISSNSFAQSYLSAVTTATAGAGVAAVEPGDTGAINPANLVHLRGRYIFLNSTGPQSTVSLSDNMRESTLPGALAYTSQSYKVNGQDVGMKDLLVSLADFFMPNWSMGVTAHFYDAELNGAKYKKTNADLGVNYTPKPYLGFGFVVYNLFVADDNMPVILRQKTEAAFGANLIYRESVRFRADIRSIGALRLGLESFLNSYSLFRGGVNFENNNVFATLGFGFKGPRFSFNYAYNASSEILNSRAHSIDLVVPF